MRTLLSTALLSASLLSQTYTVVPAACATAEAGGNNTIPFWGTSPGYFRYQQPSGELKGLARIITELAWRRDGSLGASTSYGTRSFDCELWLADTDFATFSSTFANNYANPPINVFTRKVVTTPDHTNVPVGLPAPWTFAIPFDVPFVYSGAKDLLWETTVQLFSNTNSYPLDSASGLMPSVIAGYTPIDTGCTTPNGVMTLGATHTLNSATPSLSMVWNVTKGPSSAAASILVGLIDPNFALPGLCAKVHTDGYFFSIGGTTTTAGVLNTTPVTLAPYSPTLAGFQFTAQAAALDASQPYPLAVAVSNGIKSIMPQVTTNILSYRLYTQTVTPTGSLGANFALTTRFKH